MSRKVRFQLNLSGGADVLQNMAQRVVNNSAKSIAGRANSVAGSMTSKPPTFKVYSSVGVIKRGQRAISVVKSESTNPRQTYIANQALVKSRDAGKLT